MIYCSHLPLHITNCGVFYSVEIPDTLSISGVTRKRGAYPYYISFSKGYLRIFRSSDNRLILSGPVSTTSITDSSTIVSDWTISSPSYYDIKDSIPYELDNIY